MIMYYQFLSIAEALSEVRIISSVYQFNWEDFDGWLYRPEKEYSPDQIQGFASFEKLSIVLAIKLSYRH